MSPVGLLVYKLQLFKWNYSYKFSKQWKKALLSDGKNAVQAKQWLDPIYPTPPLGQDMTQGQFFKRSLTGLNSEFPFSLTSCLTKAEEPNLPYYLSIAGGRIIGFIPFPRVLVLCEIQSVLSRNWTRIAVSISCDDNHYTTGNGLISVIRTSLNRKQQLRGDMLTLDTVVQPQIMLNDQVAQNRQLSRKTPKKFPNSFWSIENWSCVT